MNTYPKDPAHVSPMPTASPPTRAFRDAYAAQRRSEGRECGIEDLLALPFVRTGPLAGQWAVRARTYQRFVTKVMEPLARSLGRPLDVADIGAGNGWLSYRASTAGHRAVALDLRVDDVDGLGAAGKLLEHLTVPFTRICGSFDNLPLASQSVDVVVFNASLHYALDLAAVLLEAARVARPGGRIVILDSPFYGDEADGTAMVAEKRATAAAAFGEHAKILMALPFVEFLTRRRLEEASSGTGLRWRRHRVWYPLTYELRPLRAMVRRDRKPSRFDIWESSVS